MQERSPLNMMSICKNLNQFVQTGRSLLEKVNLPLLRASLRYKELVYFLLPKGYLRSVQAYVPLHNQAAPSESWNVKDPAVANL